MRYIVITYTNQKSVWVRIVPQEVRMKESSTE